MKQSFLTFAALLCCLATATFAQRSRCTARYRLTVFNTATKRNFPDIDVNDVIHFSPLTATTHANRFTPFILYGYATKGVQDVAETGSNAQLLTELRRAKRQRFVRDIQRRQSLLFAPGSYSVVLTASCGMPFVSFITMVAPSPDWIVGATRLRTRRGNKFVRRMAGPLRVYDAGTDSGRTLGAANKATSPKENIAPLTGKPFNGKSIGRYVLQRL